jgi:hypothetical protein
MMFNFRFTYLVAALLVVSAACICGIAMSPVRENDNERLLSVALRRVLAKLNLIDSSGKLYTMPFDNAINDDDSVINAQNDDEDDDDDDSRPSSSDELIEAEKRAGQNLIRKKSLPRRIFIGNNHGRFRNGC